jgi:hypothetical protein
MTNLCEALHVEMAQYQRFHHASPAVLDVKLSANHHSISEIGAITQQQIMIFVQETHLPFTQKRRKALSNHLHSLHLIFFPFEILLCEQLLHVIQSPCHHMHTLQYITIENQS